VNKKQHKQNAHQKSSMKNPNWPRRAEFVNAVLLLGASYGGSVKWKSVILDGVAGKQFDKALEDANDSGFPDQRYDFVKIALKMGVPIKGLKADGTFGHKWAEVVKLCKAGQKPHKKPLPKKR